MRVEGEETRLTQAMEAKVTGKLSRHRVFQSVVRCFLSVAAKVKVGKMLVVALDVAVAEKGNSATGILRGDPKGKLGEFWVELL
ncbi:hypothetical protein HPP92_013155 [Vanilla planifolia]|uniref:Uncharacterized protein n=1 Tax=Vanilla planifolia TaxID=51239 RepID=A0A835V0C7_VANPL|nr:hypothetical protein HPP92_013155 [Vanilla planifolia]